MSASSIVLAGILKKEMYYEESYIKGFIIVFYFICASILNLPVILRRNWKRD